MDRIEKLDSIRFPLNGVRLIEASAGTGKTYTLAALYVRLVLGHGDQHSGFVRPLLPPEILVVTFTNAATLELRDRIRARLAECALIFRGDAKAEDQFTVDLLSDYPEPHERHAAATLLERAANWMDEAAIFTIHGWAQRMLKQHALQTGSVMDAELSTDESDLILQVAQDYWRIFVTPVPSAVVELIAGQFRSPEQLAKWLKPLMTREAQLHFCGTEIEAGVSPGELAPSLSGWHQKSSDAVEQLLEGWRAYIDEIEDTLLSVHQDDHFNKRRVSESKLKEQLAQMRAWVETGEAPEKRDELLDWLDFSPEMMKAKKPVPTHACTDLIAQAVSVLEQKPGVAPALMHALNWMTQRFLALKQTLGVLEFDDLLLGLSTALTHPSGSALQARLREQFPVAMIDEFQDTDPLQYQIFSTLYLNSEISETPCALFMIGDPKQAIYSFRGADIHTYLKAREDARDALYNLPTNYRSAHDLVTAVNQLFLNAEAKGRGAFLFKQADQNPIPFLEVSSNGRKESMQIAGQTEGLTLMLLPPEEGRVVNAETYRRSMSEICAQRISVILNQAQTGEAALGDQPIQASDIAVLVRSGREARAVRTALDQLGIASVYLSDNESVFETSEAIDLWRWLSAILNPRSQSLLLAALAAPSMAYSLADLQAVRDQESVWDTEVERFIALGQVWKRAGVLAAVRRLLEQYGVARRLLKQPGGERSLTNLLHLAELLQRESRRVEGEQGVLRYLAEQISQPSGGGDQKILRMESDASRVQVITLHKSKGLEYPLVFIPFGVSTPRPIKSGDGVLWRPEPNDDEGSTDLIYELGKPSDQGSQRVSLEQLQEDIRLLYVGLTRPKYACWMGVAPIQSVHKTAFASLLGIEGSIKPDQFCEAVNKLAGLDQIQVETVSVPDEALTAPQAAAPELEPARTLERPVVAQPWFITSYSGITRRLEQPLSQPSVESDTPEADQAAEHGAESSVGHQPAKADSIHSFAKGAIPGIYLHSVLERAGEQGFAATVSSPELRAAALQLEQQPKDWQPFAQILDRWLVQQLNTPVSLNSTPVALGDLTTYRCEMEFWFALNRVDLSALDRICTETILPGAERPALQMRQVHGLLKGFIDLVFEADGRFWIADYKSNYLGPDDSAYTQARMAETVLHSRYDLQMLIYLLALHRLLKARDLNYAADPEAGFKQRIGGAAYLFLRGIGEPSGQGVFQASPEFGQIEALDQLLQGGAHAAA